jgi:hypothetical protein
MSQAIFALLGALIGALGAVSSNLIVARRADTRSQREALRTAATEFAAAISRIRHLSYQAPTGVQTTGLDLKFQEAHTAARVEYERLRLLCESLTAQEAARFALRHAYNTWTVANDTSRRMDEYATVGPWEQCDERLKNMFVVVRRELGLANPTNVFPEPDR